MPLINSLERIIDALEKEGFEVRTANTDCGVIVKVKVGDGIGLCSYLPDDVDKYESFAIFLINEAQEARIKVRQIESNLLKGRRKHDVLN